MLTPTNGTRISSRNIFFFKRVFPLLWFGFIALFTVAALFALIRAAKPAGVVILIGPVCMTLLGYFLMRRLVFDLADEVYDEGEDLCVRIGDQEARIRLDNIINVSYAGLTNPPRVTLTLRQPSVFGKEVTFVPIQKIFGPLLRLSNPIVSDLIERVDATRRR
jgi:hypothetical protein